jgi:RNA polymerase sigma factor (sigma-70 family)
MPSDVRLNLLGSAVKQAPKVMRFLSAKVRDAAEPQDLMQEIYLRILRLQRPEAIRNPTGYLFRVAANIAHEHRLRRDAQPPLVVWDEETAEILRVSAEASEVTAPEAAAALTEQLQMLQVRLQDLSPKIQSAIVWHHRDGYTCEEIGERLCVVRHRVKKYLAKGLAHCRELRPYMRLGGNSP